MEPTNDEALRVAVRTASNQILGAIEILARAGIDRASFEMGAHEMRLDFTGDETFVSLRFESKLKGDDAKLPGMTPSRTPERPIDIDKGDLS